MPLAGLLETDVCYLGVSGLVSYLGLLNRVKGLGFGVEILPLNPNPARPVLENLYPKSETLIPNTLNTCDVCFPFFFFFFCNGALVYVPMTKYDCFPL